jgi:hypothetical protein
VLGGELDVWSGAPWFSAIEVVVVLVVDVEEVVVVVVDDVLVVEVDVEVLDSCVLGSFPPLRRSSRCSSIEMEVDEDEPAALGLSFGRHGVVYDLPEL